MNRLIITGLALGLIACGGDDGGDGDGDGDGDVSCTTPACGGDPVGVWTIDDTCVSGDFTVEECPDLAVNSLDFTQSGTITIDADMSYTSATTTSGTADVTFPASCFGGLLTDCTQLNDTDVSCTGDAQTECDCILTIDETDNDTGSWTVSGNQITLDDGTGSPETSDFCVVGDSAVVSTTDEDGFVVQLVLSR